MALNIVNMKLTLSFGLILVLQNKLGHNVLGQRSQCSFNDMKQFDELVAKFVTIGNSGRKFPESKGPDVEKYCEY